MNNSYYLNYNFNYFSKMNANSKTVVTTAPADGIAATRDSPSPKRAGRMSIIQMSKIGSLLGSQEG